MWSKDDGVPEHDVVFTGGSWHSCRRILLGVADTMMKMMTSLLGEEITQINVYNWESEKKRASDANVKDHRVILWRVVTDVLDNEWWKDVHDSWSKPEASWSPSSTSASLPLSSCWSASQDVFWWQVCPTFPLLRLSHWEIFSPDTILKRNLYDDSFKDS